MDVADAKFATELLHGGDLVWIEWLPRKDRGGSYLRTLDHKPIAEDKSSYFLNPGTDFVYKAPDQPAHNFRAPSELAIPKTKDPVAIAQAVARGAKILPDPAAAWSGLVASHYLTFTELKKDWLDGDLVEVDWASGRGNDDGRAYIRIVKGRMFSSSDGIPGVQGARYKLMAGTIFDLKVPHQGVERRVANQDFHIAKTGWPPIGDVQVFSKELR